MAYLLILILVIWIASVSGRVSRLERSAQVGSFTPPTKKPLPVVPPPPPAAALAPQPPSAPKRSEAEVFTSWLGRIGVVALTLGMAFFFKYAVDQGWIGQWPRIGIGVVVGSLLLMLGELWRDRYGSRAHALSGGGVAVWYFTLFAAYQFYHLVPQPLVLALAVAVAAASVLLSRRYSSLPLAVLGYLGAYGAPVAFRSGADQQLMIFTYLTVLNVALLVTWARKFWPELFTFAVLGTAFNFTLWAVVYQSPTNTYLSLWFIIVSAVLWFLGASATFRAQVQGLPSPGRAAGLVTAGLTVAWLFTLAAAFFLLNDDFHQLLAPVALLFSVLSWCAYAVVDRLEHKAVNYALAVPGTVFFILSAAWQFDGLALGAVWLVVAIAGVALGVLLKREEVRESAVLVLTVSLLKAFLEPSGTADEAFLLNARFGLMFAEAVGLVLTGWMLAKVPATRFESGAREGLEVAAALVLWLSVTLDAASTLPLGAAREHAAALWWVLSPAVLLYLAAALGRRKLFVLGLLLTLLGAGRVLWLDRYGEFQVLWNAKLYLMLLSGLSLLFAGRISKDGGAQGAAPWFRAMGSLMLWLAVSQEIARYFQHSVNAKNLTLSLWWAVYAVALTAVGFLSSQAIYRRVGFTLFAFTILKVFLYDSSALDTPYRIIAFITLGFILLAVSFAYRKNRDAVARFLGTGTGVPPVQP